MAEQSSPPSPPPSQSSLQSQHAAEMTVTLSFGAAHQLKSCHLNSEQNVQVYGPCSNIHGHNYVVKVRVQGHVNPINGMIINLKIISAILNEIVQEFDHKFIDQDVSHFKDNQIPSTSENMAVYFYDQLAMKLNEMAKVKVVSIKVKETPKYAVYYYGQKV